MSACGWGGCGRPARWQIGFKIWALATAPAQRRDGNCARMLSSITVCEGCAPKLKVEDFLLPEGRARISAGFSKLGKSMPDFSSAKLDLVEIVGEPVDVLQGIEDAKRRGERVEEA